MSIKTTNKNYTRKISPKSWALAAPVLTRVKPLRRLFIKKAEKYVREARKSLIPVLTQPPGVNEDMNEFTKVFMETADRILSHHLSNAYIKGIANILVDLLAEGGQKDPVEQFHKSFQTNPPLFLTISPGKRCNLNCIGCYANSGSNSESLEWHIFDRVITEAKTLWGVRFLVISGGEPLAYRSEGKGLLDMVEKHPDIFFLMFTNGTLIDDAVAKRMAGLGNITPAISVEGQRELTDKRRGEGVFDRVLSSMKRLRKAGVPFGISLTATCENAEEIFSDDFLDLFYEEQGALYGWVFHYMPIGRSFTLDLMPTPEQRIWMWKRVWEIIHQRHIFLADFWNHGTLTSGCIAAGRSDGGGYLYIDWNGAVSPCVFVPYSPVNVNEIYAHGQDLNDIWQNPFFKGVRDWQFTYREQDGNLLAPCINRDHHADLRRLIALYEPDPIDENAHKALLDPGYENGLNAYGEAYQTLSDQYWQKYYLHPVVHNGGHDRPTPD